MPQPKELNGASSINYEVIHELTLAHKQRNCPRPLPSEWAREFFDSKSTRCVPFCFLRPLTGGEGDAALFKLFIWLFCCASAAYGAGIESKHDSQSEWEKITQGAKKEGELSLYLYQGDGELGALSQLFPKKYPEINS